MRGMEIEMRMERRCDVMGMEREWDGMERGWDGMEGDVKGCDGG